jgi:hypothetical protein
MTFWGLFLDLVDAIANNVQRRDIVVAEWKPI